MKALLLLVTLLSTTITFAAEQADPSDGRGIPLATGAVSTAVGASSVILNRSAARQESLIATHAQNIEVAERRLADLEVERAQLEAFKPEDYINRRFSIEHSIPAVGSAAPQSIFYQEYITDPELSARAENVLEQMRRRVGHPDAAEISLNRIRDVSTSALQEEYDQIIKEAQEKGLIRYRRAEYLEVEFSMMDGNERTAHALLEREGYRQRGFMDQRGIKGKTNEFVLRIRKEYTLSGLKEVKAREILRVTELADHIRNDKARFTQEQAKLERSAPRARKLARLTKWAGIGGGIGSIGLGWMMTTSSSSEAELFEETNPSPLTSDDVTPKANQ